MTTTLRAAVSAVLLAGFYVVALAIIVGMGALTVWAFQSDEEAAAAKLGFFTAAIALGVVVALWQVARARQAPDVGPVLTPADAPALWETVRELAAAAGTRAPDDIRLLPDVNAAVSEDAKLLGLVGGKRHLYLGVPLLQTLDVGQLRSVLAHELGHYSNSHTRLGALTYRGQQAIIATLQQLSGNIVGWFLRMYAHLFFAVSAAVSRRQELEADQLSVRIAGRATAQSALRELPVADAAWTFYLTNYLEDAWESGYAPTAHGFFGGFGHLVAGRTAELATMRAEAPPAEQSRWDSHPSIAARVTAMDAMPDVAVGRDTRPASVLIPGFDDLATQLAAQVVDVEGRTQLDWEELTATSLVITRQRTADIAYRAAARVAGLQRANLATVLDVVADGRRDELEKDLGFTVENEETHPFSDVLELLVCQATVQAGIARWQHSWSGPAVLVDRDGQPLDLSPVWTAALEPETVGAARARLAELGVDITSTGQVADTATAHGAEVLGGLASVKVDGTKHDVIVLDTGIILVPTPKQDENGKARMFGLLQSGSVVQLASYHRFLAYEQIAAAKITKRTPLHAELTLHDGRTVSLKETWTGESLAKDSSLRLLERLLAYEPEVAQA